MGGYQAADTMHQEGTALLLQRLLRMCILCTNWATEGNGLDSQGSAAENISANFTLGKQGGDSSDSFQHLGQTNT